LTFETFKKSAEFLQKKWPPSKKKSERSQSPSKIDEFESSTYSFSSVFSETRTRQFFLCACSLEFLFEKQG